MQRLIEGGQGRTAKETRFAGLVASACLGCLCLGTCLLDKPPDQIAKPAWWVIQGWDDPVDPDQPVGVEPDTSDPPAGGPEEIGE